MDEYISVHCVCVCVNSRLLLEELFVQACGVIISMVHTHWSTPSPMLF